MSRRSYQRFGGAILSAEEIARRYQADLESGQLTPQQLTAIYGKELWFLKNPGFPPPLHYYASQTYDSLHRGYSVTASNPNTVYIQLERSPSYSTSDVLGRFPEPNEEIRLHDGRRFRVVNCYTPPTRTKTGTLTVVWLD